MGRRLLLLTLALAVVVVGCRDGDEPLVADPPPARSSVLTVDRDGRDIETTFSYPFGGGPFPLIVFSHGLSADVPDHERFKERLVEAGYVVAAPRYPGTWRGAPGGPDRDDVFEQPADVSAVLDSAPGDRRIDFDRVVAMGHSFGAVTSWWLTSNTCCFDERVDAAVLLAPTPLEHPGGTEDHAGQPPTMVVHGDADEALPYADAVALVERLVEPKRLFTIPGGDHNSWVRGESDAFEPVVDAVLAFLEEHLLES